MLPGIDTDLLPIVGARLIKAQFEDEIALPELNNDPKDLEDSEKKDSPDE